MSLIKKIIISKYLCRLFIHQNFQWEDDTIQKNLFPRIKMIKSYKQILLILVSTLFFTACSIKEAPLVTPKNSDIEKLATLANDDFINQQMATKDFFDN